MLDLLLLWTWGPATRDDLGQRCFVRILKDTQREMVKTAASHADKRECDAKGVVPGLRPLLVENVEYKWPT